MNASTQQENISVSDRFNAFLLEVSVISDQMKWVLVQLSADDPGLSILQSMQERLDALCDAQDCREG